MSLTSGEKVHCAEGNPIHNNYSLRLCQLIHTIIKGFANFMTWYQQKSVSLCNTKKLREGSTEKVKRTP